MAVTYEAIATTTVGSSVSSVTLSSIPATYTDLKIIIKGSMWSAGGPTIQFNGDTGSNYGRIYLVGFNSIASSASTVSASGFNIGYWENNNQATAIVDVLFYAGSTHKTVIASLYAKASSNPRLQHNVAYWANTAAITSVTLNAGFDTGSMITIYGIKAA